MPSIVPIKHRETTGFIAGIRYRSGRQIFVADKPEQAEFVEAACNARIFTDSREAKDAACALIDAFEVRDPSTLHLFVMPYSR